MTRGKAEDAPLLIIKKELIMIIWINGAFGS